VETLVDEFFGKIETQYREGWNSYSPARCREFITCVEDPDAKRELLVRLLCIDLELSRTQRIRNSQIEADDEASVCPKLELLRYQFPELDEDQLGLERLIVLDFALSLQHDATPPNIDSYVELCPTERLVRNLEVAQTKLQEIKYASTDESPAGQSVDKSKSTVPQSSKLSAFVAPHVPFTLGRFLLIRYIGRGGMGFVYAAIDLSSTAQVAVKMMRRGDGWSVFRFIEEFRWLNQLQHPNLVRLYAAFAEGDARYFSMEYIEGEDIKQWYQRVRQDNKDNQEALQHALGQLASAIHFLHTQGVIHRDIKSSNVLITPRGRTVLLDLGLAIRQSDQNLDSPSPGEAMPGTLVYMSPEAYNNLPLTAASDWYSFGVTIYELLAGEVPKASVKKFEFNPREFEFDEQLVRKSLEHAPATLSNLCVRLLSHDPSMRPDGKEILKELNHPETQSAELFERSVGRTIELAALNNAKDECLSSHNQLIVLSGDAGMGKSHLLKYWLSTIDRSDWYVVLIGNNRQDHTPNRLINAFVQELVRIWGADPQVIGEVFQPFVRQIGLDFPQILQLCSEVEAPLLSTDPKVDSADSGIANLISAVVKLSSVKPIIIAIDDVTILKGQFRGLIVLASDLAELSNIEPDLSPVASMVKLHLHSLTNDECQGMLNEWSQASGITLSFAEMQPLIALSKGSPFLLRELFRSMLDQQIASGDLVKPEVTVGQLVSRRFAKMPKLAEGVLQVLAIAERPVLFQQILSTCRLTPLELQSCLNLLSHQGWIRVRNEWVDTAAELASENFRDAIVHTMDQDQLIRRHFRFAKMLSSEIDPQWSRIAYHYERAQKFRLAAVCHAQAAQDAFRLGDFAEALHSIERSSHTDAHRSASEQLRLELIQAESHAAFGNLEVATATLNAAAEQAEPERVPELRARAAGYLLRMGKLKEGIRLLTDGLSKVNSVNGHQNFMRLRNTLAAWRIASRLVPKGLIQLSKSRNNIDSSNANQDTEVDEAQNGLIDALVEATIPLWVVDHDQAGALIVRLTFLSENPKLNIDLRSRALLLSTLLLLQTGQGNDEQVITRLMSGVRVAQQLGASNSVYCHLTVMTSCLHQARFRAAMRSARKVKKNSRSTSLWEYEFASWNECNLLWLSGRIPEFLDAAKANQTKAEVEGQSTYKFLCSSFSTVTCSLVKDQIDPIRSMLSQNSGFLEADLKQPTCLYWLAQIAVELYQGNWQKSHELIQERWNWLSHSGLLKFGNIALQVLSYKINTSLLEARDEKSISKRVLGEIRLNISKLRQTNFAALRSLAYAYELMLNSMTNGVVNPGEWERVRIGLAHSGLGLFSRALQWHESLLPYSATPAPTRNFVQEEFRKQGCQSPEKLMNLLLPLPHYHA
jgi:serine/threonine protein kinase